MAMRLGLHPGRHWFDSSPGLRGGSVETATGPPRLFEWNHKAINSATTKTTLNQVLDCVRVFAAFFLFPTAALFRLLDFRFAFLD